MARGFNAGERTIRGILAEAGKSGSVFESRNPTSDPGGIAGERTTFPGIPDKEWKTDKEIGADKRSPFERDRDSKAVKEMFDKAIKEYTDSLKAKKGFGASEEKPDWFPKKQELPSSRNEYATSSAAAYQDTLAIISKIPRDVTEKIAKDIFNEMQRQEKNLGSSSENGINAIVMNKLRTSNPEVYAAYKDVVARQLVARSADLKKNIEKARSEDKSYDAAYGAAWKAANKAFDEADEVAKMVLKRGDESYGEAREFQSVSGTFTGTRQELAQLRPGEPSISGRVLAVNSGILMARRAAEAVLNKMEKDMARANKKDPSQPKMSAGVRDDVLAALTQKMIADKGAFLSVRGYIPPTARYVGPVKGNKNPVEHVGPGGSFGGTY